ncbi:MAG TPA: M15 family metallopeptidase [Actinomycetota bacterium]|nr:M15 family metallopeptidase [Actinomycetota bacterium]
MDRKRIAIALVLACLPVWQGAPAAAYHFPGTYYPHRHKNYPPRPHGQAALVREFGERCSAAARANKETWWAKEGIHGTGSWRQYPFNYHERLGGKNASAVYDVWAHAATEHEADFWKIGIWGYNCRKIKGSSKWSSHSWGVAIDTNSAYEHVGAGHKHCHTMTPNMPGIWKDHGWHHGVSFGDCMHFQYVTGY